MSSFKRKTPSKQVALPPGTRTCPTSISTVLTSSGIPSFDDILGGGVPLSCSLVVLAPDSQSAYGELVQKYFVAQGIANGHKVCIAHEDVLYFVKECMWMPTSSSNHPMPIVVEDDAVQKGEKVKIAWRYEQMKTFETTVTDLSGDHYCDTFDLTCRIPMSVIDEARKSKRLITLDCPTISNDLDSSMDGRMEQIKHILVNTPSSEVVRLSIVALGSPELGEHCPADILRFLYGLRRLLRRYPRACACVSLAPHFCTDLWAGSGWVQKVGWMSDGAISISGFGGNPALTALFPSHHGLVRIYKLPGPRSILPTSDKYSILRGLSSSAATNVGSGENNLAFKCMRKRLIIETMHLDSEGGVTERRTTASSTGISLNAGLVHTHITDKGMTVAPASVAVELEETSVGIEGESLEGRVPLRNGESGMTATVPMKAKKTKKKVAFRSDKPDLYDF